MTETFTKTAQKASETLEQKADKDMIALYSTRILALSANIPYCTRLENPDGTGKKRAPLCGSVVTVDVALENGFITKLGMDVRACALGQASASVLGHAAIGKTPAQIQQARDSLYQMLKESAPPPKGDFADLVVLTPARDYKNRHASILLAYEALLLAIEDAKTKINNQP